MIVSQTPPTIHAPREAWVMLAAVAVTGLSAQLAQVAALQRLSGGRVAVLGYLQVPFSIIFQAIFTTAVPKWTQVVGMTVIVLSGVWAATAGVPNVEDVQPRDEVGETLPFLSENDGIGRDTNIELAA
ncbi:hypothetical protein P7C73_g6705, partial [Tremellales sp. Uapishka_1]